MKRLFWPLVVLASLGALVALLGAGLGMDPRAVPSARIDKPAPAFILPRVDDPAKTVTLHDLKGQVSLVNVWASWCASCRIEHPVLMGLAARGGVPVYGLNYKDERTAAVEWLQRHGDPYQASGSDTQGLAGMDFGVFAVPETFVIDREGVIRHRHTGPLTPEVLEHTLLPLVRSLGG